MGKKILLLIVILILLIAIPLTVYLLQQQTQTKGKAEKATTLSFSTPNTQINVGSTFDLVVTITPGAGNQISFVKLNIQYDGTKLTKAGAGLVPIPRESRDKDLITLEPAQFDPCNSPACFATITLSIGANPNNAITSQTPIAKITFQAIGATDTNPTVVSFGDGTKALSLGSTDPASQDVLSSKTPISITVVAPTPGPTAEPTSTPEPTAPPTTNTGETTNTTNTTGGTTSGGTTTTTTTTTVAPSCSGLTADKTNGTVPLAVNFAVSGSISSGNISKATFNFGDGTVQTVTSGNGIGSATVSNAPISHTYNNAGTYTATATLTDNNGNVSNPTACSKTITIATTAGTIPAAGPEKLITVGVIGAVIAIFGAGILMGL